MAQLNTLRAIQAVAGKPPVNLIVIAEGDEERMSIGLRQFVKTHPELFKDAELLWNDGGQAPSGRSGISTGDSEGCVYIELTTSGAKWGAARRCRIFTVATSGASIARRGAT